MIAVAYVAVVIVLAVCSGYACAVLGGHQGRPGRLGCLRRTAASRVTRAVILAAIAVLSVRAVRTAVLRVRWAWRCRGKPVPGDGEKLTRDEAQALGNLAAGRDVRSRT